MIAERETAAGTNGPRRRSPWAEGTVPLGCPEDGAEDERQRRLEIVRSRERRARKMRLALFAVAAIVVLGGVTLLASSLDSAQEGGHLVGARSLPSLKSQNPTARIAAAIPVRKARPAIARGGGARHPKDATRGKKRRARDGEGVRRAYPPPSEPATPEDGASYEAAEAEAPPEPVAPESIEAAPVSRPPAASGSEFGFEH